MTHTRIFIVHENSILAGQAASVLNQTPNLHVMDLITSTQEALASIGDDNCDVVLVSTSLAKNGAIQLIKCIRQQSEHVKVIVTGLRDDPKQILPYLAAGAVGYILKAEGVATWSRHIEASCKGKPIISPVVAAALPKQINPFSRFTAHSATQAEPYTKLNSRQCEILDLLAEGGSTEWSANRVFIDVGAAQKHIHTMLEKLHLPSRKGTSAYRSLEQRRTALAQISYAH